MFGFTRPSLPVTPEPQAWLDERAKWIADEFGEARQRNVRVIMPTPEFFPDRFDGTEAVHAANWSRGGWSGWKVGRQGYLSQREWGYALAKFAMSREEPKPAWAAHLRPDIRALFKQSVRYLVRGD